MGSEPDELRGRLDRAREVARFAEACGDESALRVAGMVVAGLLGSAEDEGEPVAHGSAGTVGPDGLTERRESK